MCCEREVDSRQSTVDSQPLSGRRGARAPHCLFLLSLIVFVAGAVSCGKKGDPQAPLPRGARAVSDLAVEQEGGDAVLTFTYPDRLLTGEPLTDLASIAVYRVVDPPASLTAPKPGARFSLVYHTVASDGPPFSSAAPVINS